MAFHRSNGRDATTNCDRTAIDTAGRTRRRRATSLRRLVPLLAASSSLVRRSDAYPLFPSSPPPAAVGAAHRGSSFHRRAPPPPRPPPPSAASRSGTTALCAIVRSPMRFLGPYPAMPLRFPNLSTSSQRERNVSGISLDWILDTASNVNTINAGVAVELALVAIGVVPGGVAASGDMGGGNTYLLGDCTLEERVPRSLRGGAGPSRGEEDEDEIENDANEDANDDDANVFMKGLTASALPVASPAAAGLLGLAFFYCFENGVEFRWGRSEKRTEDGDNIDDDDDDGPSVTFYGPDDGPKYDGLTRVSFVSLPISMLPSVTLVINGVEMPALFDTGSPITVLNSRAASMAGIDTVMGDAGTSGGAMAGGGGGGWGNPFAKLASNVRSAREAASATARGDMLTIIGSGGSPVRLVRTKSIIDVDVLSASGGPTSALSSARLYVGDLPGLEALGGLGGDAPPAAVLGMDLIGARPRVIFRARQNEIYL